MKKTALLFFVLSVYCFGFTPNPALDTLSDNMAYDCGAYSCNQPVGSSYYCEHITDYSGFTYDKHNHQMLMFGGGHASTFRDDVDVFSFATLRWQPAYNSTPCADMTDANLDRTKGCWKTTNHPFSRHSYDLLVVTGNTKEFLLMCPFGFGSDVCENASYNYPAGSAAHYNPAAKTWTYGASMSGVWGYEASAEWDPVSNQVLVAQGSGLWTYNPSTKVITQRLSFSKSMGYCNQMVYYPPNDRFYYIVRGAPTAIWEIALNRSTWSGSTVTLIPPANTAPSTDEAGWDYDSVNQIIGGGVRNGVFYVYHPPTRTWTSQTIRKNSANAVGSVPFHALAYDPVDNVFLFCSYTGYMYAQRTWAYRYKKAVVTAAEKSPAHPDGVQVFPNPAKAGDRVRMSGCRGPAALYDVHGRKIMEAAPSFRLPGLAPGVYILRTGTGEKGVGLKILVER